MAEVATMMARPHPFPKPGGISTTHRDITDEKYRDLRRPRKVRFFANGNRYFKGKKMHITPHRYLTFNDLLNDLTGKLPATVQLPYGVRQIFTPVTGRRVKDIDELQDGGSYVCAGFDTFKGIKYAQSDLEPWNAGKSHNHDVFDFDVGSNTIGRPYNGFYPSRALRHSYPTRKQYGTFGSRSGAGSYWKGPSYAQDHMLSKPKVITVIRNGPNRPRGNVKILLNRRSVQSFEQLMRDIAEAFGPKWRNNKVRKLFNTKGREIQGVSDFFRDDEVFIGVGNDSLTTGEVQEILEELYPDSPYAKNLMKEWEKTKKRYQGTHHYKIKEETPRHDESKIDSGLGSDADNTDDVIYRGKAADYYRSGKKKQKQPLPSYEDDHPIRIEQERMRAAEDERERARKRMQKRLEAERRATDEERRRRGLVPLKPIQDPFKKHESPEQKAPESEIEPSQVELPKIRRKKHRVPRMETHDEPKVIVIVKGDENQESSKSPTRKNDDESDQNRDTARKPKPKTDDQEQNQQPEHKTEEEESKQQQQSKNDNENNLKPKPKHDDVDENNRKPKPKKKLENEENSQREKENEEPNVAKDEEQKEVQQKEKKKKSKPKMIYKSKIERQVSNADHATNKYEPGKTLGDGNFAIVKQCRLNNTNNEYAMKIIDKSKLKGKEHMIENEIEIMKLCNHPNITRLIEEYETNDEIYLIMELVKGGDLFDAITQSVKFKEDHSSSMVSNLAQALFFLHSRGIVHRDLKPENLLVQRNKDNSITLKLADFGLAMEVKEQIYTVCGTPTYVAPEILAETGYGLEVDMWALGVITYILLCGFPPFRSPDRKQTELFEFIKAGEYEFLSPYWDNISKSAKDLIRRLLIVDRKKRYTAVDALCHPWIITRGGIDSIDDMETHRKSLRSDLESQAKVNRESYVREHHKQG